MAELNIRPDPTVIALQFGIFMASVYSVKKLILQPYLSMREQRQTATSGQKGDADDLLAQNKSLAEELEKKWSASTTAIRDEIAKIRKEAQEKKSVLVAAAEAEARQTIKEMQTSLRQNLEQERQKLPEIVSKIAGEWYAETIH